MGLYEILRALAEPRGPSGHEPGVTARARSLLAGLTDETWTDAMGNLFALRRCGRPNAKTVLLDAHLDEIGFMVTGAQDGFTKFRATGSIDARLWPGAELLILADPPVKAVVACLPPHLLDKGADKAAPVKDLFLDTGGAEAPPGSVGVFATAPVRMGAYVTGSGLDNRAGFAALVWMLQNLPGGAAACDILICGSVQEEVGTRGAAAAARDLTVDAAVVVDVTYGESPGSKEDTFPLGGGVCVNRGPDCNRALTERLINLAETGNIPHQIEVTCGMSRTNATPLQIAGAGIATAVLSVPLRYMHTPVETLCLQNIEATAALLREWVTAG